MKLAVRLAVFFGSPVGAFVAVSPFYPIDHWLWLRINDMFFFATLFGVAILGWKLGRVRRSSFVIIQAILLYAAGISALFMAAYLSTTWFFADELRWIPFFHLDYIRHGFLSVRAYLFTGDNYIELAKLHLFSLAVCSVLYATLGGIAAAAAKRLTTAISKHPL